MRLILALFLAISSLPLLADSDGPRAPTESTGSSGCTSPDNVFVSDGTGSLCGPAGDVHESGTYDFTTSGTVVGVSADFDWRCVNCEGGEQVTINLTGVGTCTAKTATNPADIPDTDGDGFDVTFGSSSDTWSCTDLTAANVNAAAFGILVTTSTGIDNSELNYDAVQVTVEFTPGAAGRRRTIILENRIDNGGNADEPGYLFGQGDASASEFSWLFPCVDGVEGRWCTSGGSSTPSAPVSGDAQLANDGTLTLAAKNDTSQVVVNAACGSTGVFKVQ